MYYSEAVILSEVKNPSGPCLSFLLGRQAFSTDRHFLAMYATILGTKT